MIKRPPRRIMEGLGWLVLGVLGGVGVVVSIWMSLTLDVMPLIALALVPTAVALPLADFLAAQHEGRLSRGRRMAIGALLLTLTVVLSDWPFRLVLGLSRPALRRAARAIDSGAKPSSSLGWFPIRRVEERAGVTAYWTDLDPSGFSGLVYSPSGSLPFNLWSERALGEGWYFISED